MLQSDPRISTATAAIPACGGGFRASPGVIAVHHV
jgi:hypothetical protein